MEILEVTRDEVESQLAEDIETKKALKASPFVKYEELGYYAERIAQIKEILKNGRGPFSHFKNAKIEVVIK